MELSIIFNEKVSVKNKFHLKQTNSSLFAIILFLWTALCIGHCQRFQTITTKKIVTVACKNCPVSPKLNENIVRTFQKNKTKQITKLLKKKITPVVTFWYNNFEEKKLKKNYKNNLKKNISSPTALRQSYTCVSWKYLNTEIRL